MKIAYEKDHSENLGNYYFLSQGLVKPLISSYTEELEESIDVNRRIELNY